MFDLIKILAAAFVMIGLGVAVIKMDDSGAGSTGGSGFSLFQEAPEHAKTQKPKKAKKHPPGPAGVVAEHQPGLLVIAPWVGDMTTVKATAGQQAACQVGDRYPGCL